MRISVATFITWGCGILSVVGFFYAFTAATRFHAENEARLAEGLTSARGEAERAQDRMLALLTRAADSVDEAGENLMRPGHTDEPNLLAVLRSLMYANSGFVEVGVAFVPFSYDRQTRLYGLSYIAGTDGIRYRDLDTDQDYAKPGIAWYYHPLSGKAVWLEPLHDVSRERMVVTYSAPVFKPGDFMEPVGVVYAVYALDAVQAVLNEMELGENGFGFLLSTKKHFFLHPDKQFVDDNLSISEFQSKLSQSSLEAVESALRDVSLSARYTVPGTGSRAQLFFQNIPIVEWTLGVVMIDEDLVISANAARPTLIRIALVLAASVVLLVIALSGVVKGSISGFWVVSSVFALCCILVTGFILWLETGEPPRDRGEALRITNRNMLNQFMFDQRRRTLDQHDEVPLFIPTGIFVQSIAFESGNDVRLTGYVWQRYSQKVHDGVARGFVMPGSKSFYTSDPVHDRVR